MAYSYHRWASDRDRDCDSQHSIARNGRTYHELFLLYCTDDDDDDEY